MRIKLNYITPLLAAGAAAVAIAAAPIAAAASVNDPGAGQPSCTYVGGAFQDNRVVRAISVSTRSFCRRASSSRIGKRSPSARRR